MVTVKYFPDISFSEYETKEFNNLADFLRWVNLPKEELINLRFFKGDVLGEEINTEGGEFIFIDNGLVTVINNKSVPNGPVSWVYVAVTVITALIAVKIASQAKPSISLADSGANRSQGSTTNKLGASNNVAAVPNERIDDIFGTVTKHTPKFWQVPYRIGINNQETEVQFLCVGRGRYDIDLNKVYDNNTRHLDLSGSSVNFFEPGSWPGNGTPSQTIGSIIDRPIGIYRENASLNSTELLPPNDLTLGSSAQWSVSGDGSNGVFTLTNINELEISLNDYVSVGQNLIVLDSVVESQDTVETYWKTSDASLFGSVSSDVSKWNGGVLAPNGKIYGVPYYSTQVLEIDPVTQSIVLFGSLPVGDLKWQGGVLASNGKIYCTPRNSTQILEIDPVTQSTVLFGSFSSDAGKWLSSVLADNGKIYCVPFNSTQVLEIDPTTQSTVLFGSLPGTSKWSHGVLADNGKIYCVPSSSTQILEIDPVTQSTVLFGSFSSDALKWGKSVLADNGKIYGIPSSSTQVLEIDPVTQSTVLFGSFSSDALKWTDGVLADNGKIYCVPFASDQVLEIDPVTQSSSLFGSFAGSLKWYGGVLGSDGKIYCIPSTNTRVLEIDPVSKTTVLTGDELPVGNSKWFSGVLADNGKIYGIPFNSDQVLEVETDLRTYYDFNVDFIISGGYLVTSVTDASVTVSGFPFNFLETTMLSNSRIVRGKFDQEIKFLTRDTDILLHNYYLASTEELLTYDEDDTHKSDVGQSFDNTIGPFKLEENVTSVIVNLTSFSGFYKINGSNYTGIDAQVRITIDELDVNGAPTGNQETTIVEYSTHPTNRTSSVYQTYEITVPYSNSRIYASRVTDRDKSEGITNIDKIEWTLLYTYQPVPIGTDLGDVTTMHVLVPSNSQSRLVKERKTNLTVTRMINQYIGGGAISTGEEYATDRFDQILIHTALDPYCGRLTLNDINADNIIALYNEIIAYSGDESMTSFGYDFDTTQMSYDDMFTMICDVVNCIPYNRGSKYDAFFEGEQVESSLQITHRNKKPNSETRLDDFSRVYDGVELTYRSNEDGQSKTIVVPEDGTSKSPEKKELQGCVTELQATQYAKRMYNRQKYQRTTVSFDTDEFGRMVTPGQRIDSPDGTRFSKFSNTTDGYKIYDGEIVEVNGLNVELSQPVQFTDGENHYIRFTNIKGENSELIQCYATDDEFVVTLNDIPNESLYDGYDRDRTKFTFCSEQLRGSIALIPQTIEAKIDDKGVETITITSKNYDSRVYKDDVRST